MSSNTRSGKASSNHKPIKAKNNQPTINQSPLSILPDISPDQGSLKDLTSARSFVTQTWTIPDRPKPGRKPKQKPPREACKQPASGSADAIQNSTLKSKLPSISPLEPEAKVKELNTNVSPESLQQAYINSLEGKIEALQSHQSEQVNYYKTLAFQSASKIKKIQSENSILHSQIKNLKEEVVRLRKLNSNPAKRSVTDDQQTPIVIEDECVPKESKVRKQISDSNAETGGNNSLSPDSSIKKSRRQSLDKESNQLKTKALPVSTTTSHSIQSPSEIYLVQDPRNSPVTTDNLPNKRIPDFTSGDIYCGLCTSELDCVCRQVGLKPPLPSINLSASHSGRNQLAVPIRRRSQHSVGSVWRLVTEDDVGSPPGTSPKPALGSDRECNGNPKDCPACRDDPFGQAFCAALSQAKAKQDPDSQTKAILTAKTTSGHATANSTQSDPVVDAYMSIPCCGDPGLCGSQNCFDNAPSPSGIENNMKVSCSEAWRQLKAHPNIGLANLTLLADVVARKSRASPSSSTSIDPNLFTTDHRQTHRHQQDDQSNSSWSSHPILEDSTISPHVTLSTVFENIHNNFDDDRPGETHSFQASFSHSKYNSTDRDLSAQREISQDQYQHNTNVHSSMRKQVKYVEKESLDQALRMLDRSCS